MNKIPVSLITGFLGAGKTSFLNFLIKRYPEKKFAIIENEIGEENIDQELITKFENNEIFELSNGCICCNLNQDLNLLLQKLSDSQYQFNHLLIETTGIADPGSILAAFISDPIVKSQFELDSVICLADAANLQSDMAKEPILTKQIALSDIILLNKCDLIDPNSVTQIKNELRLMNSHAEILQTEFSQLESQVKVLDRFSYQAKIILQHVFQLDNGTSAIPERNQHGIESMIFKTNKPFDQMSFAMWLEAFLQFNMDSIYRVKGILNLNGMENKIIIQSVHTQIQAIVGCKWEENTARESKLVIIGKDLNREVIRKNLNDLVQ